MQRLLSGETLAEYAMETLRLNEPREGYWLAYSGGKDSDVILDLAKRSGVKYDAHYSFVPIDPPELRAHVREVAAVPENRLHIDLPPESFIAVARRRGVMPIRHRRWCCEIFKEREAKGTHVVTGIRWQESNRRKRRPMIERCQRVRTRSFLHPIINWKTGDVWQYIRERGIDYCRLYDEGWKRLGCVLCPMADDVARQMVRWPAIVRVWKAINQATWEAKGRKLFATAEVQWAWWLARGAKKADDDDCPLFDGLLE